MKLELGKTYVSVDGEKVTIAGKDRDGIFFSNEGYRFAINGEHYLCGTCNMSLVREYKNVSKTKEAATNPKDKVGAKKVSLALIPPASIIHQAAVMEDGAAKYGPFNWRDEKIGTMTYLNAALRHIMSYVDGEEEAQDSGRHHLAHALAGLGILLDAKETGNLVDDRPKPGAAARLIAELEAKKKAKAG